MSNSLVEAFDQRVHVLTAKTIAWRVGTAVLGNGEGLRADRAHVVGDVARVRLPRVQDVQPVQQAPGVEIRIARNHALLVGDGGGGRRVRTLQLAEVGIDAVSYTHLTLPTKA